MSERQYEKVSIRRWCRLWMRDASDGIHEYLMAEAIALIEFSRFALERERRLILVLLSMDDITLLNSSLKLRPNRRTNLTKWTVSNNLGTNSPQSLQGVLRSKKL